MSKAIESLGLDRLTRAEQVQLVEDLWDLIAETQEDQDLPDSHRRLLDERLAEFELNTQLGSTWLEVKARLNGSTGPNE